MKFSKIFFALSLLVAAAWCVGCASSGRADSSGVSYTEVRNYFFLTGGVVPADAKVTTRKQFDATFGAAAVMGKDGEPTPIDFKRQFVIAVVKPETAYATELVPVSLKQTEDDLTLCYRCLTGQARRPFTIRPMMMLLVDRRYAGRKVTLVEQNR